MSPSLELQIKTLPDSPGVYQYFDKEDKIIYVGKAKNLKKRVSSYFTKTHDSGKTRVLVKNINNIKHIVVNTETDETKEEYCTYEELQEILKDKKWKRVMGFPKIVSGVGSLHSKTPDGFRDRLKQIKKNSARGNTIKT